MRRQVNLEEDAVYLMDSGGRLVAYPGVTLEEFRRIYLDSKALQEQDQTPGYTIQSLSATGNAVEDRVDLQATLTIVVRSAGWVKIPLRFGQAALQAHPEVEGMHDPPIIDPEAGDETVPGGPPGYSLWLRGDGDETVQKVHLNLVVPLIGVGRERRMLLSIPPVMVSELKLRVPMAEAVANVAKGALLESPRALDDGGTEFTVRGMRGDLDLSWRSADGGAAESARVLTSVGAIEATVDGRSVDFKASLTVGAYGRELTQIAVRLPPGAVLTEESYEGYTVKEWPITDESQDPSESSDSGEDADAAEPSLGDRPQSGEGRVVQVQFSDPVDDEGVEVRLRARSDAATAADGQFNLAGFEVLDAIRQSGTVAVRTRGDWDVRYEIGLDAEQISEVPKEIQSEDLIAVFRYFDQPFTLAARVFPKQTRITVEPHYVMRVEEHAVRLEATLKYVVRGKKAHRLTVEMNGWELDRIGPDHLVIAEEWHVDETGLLRIELQEGLMAEFELLLEARRATPAGEASVSLALPQPVVNTLRAATVVVLPAENIDLRPNAAGMTGLQEQQVGPPMELPERQQEPLFYRSETGEAVFAAIIRVRKQEIAVEAFTDVSLVADEAWVRGRLSYEVKYEPATSLKVRIPRELADSDGLEFYIDGEAVAVVARQQEEVEGDLVLRQIALPAPRSGRFELVVSYPVEVPELQPLASVLCVVPLLMPEDGKLTGNRVTATIGEGLAVWLPRETPWQEVRSEGALQFSADSPQSRIVLGVHPEDPDLFGSAVVTLAWVQTWMTERHRRDRAVFRFVSDRRHLAVELPEGADTGFLRVYLDGQEVKYDMQPERRVSVVLPRDKSGLPHVLELWYPYSEPRPQRGRMVIDLPKVADGIWVRRTYWQLVLPRSEHVVSAPVGYTQEYEWGWSDAWWGRIPLMEQEELEAWIGAMEDIPVPGATSRYLFSNFGPAEPGELGTASRTWIVFTASGLTLLIGLVLVYVPATRHPAFAWILLLAVVGGAATWPGPVLLGTQAAGMGLALAVFAAVLYRGATRRRRRIVRRELPSSVSERGSTHAPLVELVPVPSRSTATEPDAAVARSPGD